MGLLSQRCHTEGEYKKNSIFKFDNVPTACFSVRELKFTYLGNNTILFIDLKFLNILCI